MKRFLAACCLATALCLLPFLACRCGADAPQQGSLHSAVLRISDHKILTLADILEDLKGVRLVFVGELHTAPQHHQAQLAVIKAMHEARLALAVGLEMFQKESQEILDQWIAGTLAEKAFQKIYYSNWGYPWPLYSDIFRYARQEKIPLVGLNISPEITRQVAREGFASLSKEQIGQLPEVACRVDATYMAFIRRSFGMHGHQGKRFVHFCEAQQVWDTAMAANLLAFLQSHPKHTVVVLAGNGHAWRHGIPEHITRQSNMAYRIILPAITGRLDARTATLEDADYLWLGD
jgi:uncharacterized iron-regulated protein